MILKKGKKVIEGKTKEVFELEGDPDKVIVESKSVITKNDDKAQTRTMENKAELATITTCIIFEILKTAGIPLAYLKRIGKTMFLAIKCSMIPLEVIVRRYAVGSYLLRHPELQRKGEAPYRFDQLLCEVFLKTTGGVILSRHGEVIGNLPIDPETNRPIDDPLIENPMSPDWKLYHPKKPISKDTYLCTVSRSAFLANGILIEEMMSTACKVFLILEDFMWSLKLRLIDFKIEFGVSPNGKLLLADVIDNDSWRLMTEKWVELSKELFRQNQAMEKIQKSYEFVAKKLQEAYRLR